MSSPSSYSIEPARAVDVDELHRLLLVLAEATGSRAFYQGSTEALRRYGFGARPHFQALLARPDGYDHGGSHSADAVGACIFLPDFSTWRGRPGVYILDLVVEPRWRSSGLGLSLLAEAARNGREQWDADYLILSVAQTNNGAIRFYQRHGFESDHHVDVMVLNGLDPIIAGTDGGLLPDS